MNKCDVCHEYNKGINHVIEISDVKQKVHINGHDQCINELFQKVHKLDYENMSVDKIMKKLGVKL